MGSVAVDSVRTTARRVLSASVVGLIFFPRTFSGFCVVF